MPTHRGIQRTVEENILRFMRFVDPQSSDRGCWSWIGGKKPTGYGNFDVFIDGRWKTHRAHRWLYEALFGPIPKSLTIDHLCRNRSCVNPDHMEAVTHAVNVSRGFGPTAVNARKTHCIYGHPFSEENTRYRGKDKRQRQCLECERRSGREKARRRRAREREERNRVAA